MFHRLGHCCGQWRWHIMAELRQLHLTQQWQDPWKIRQIYEIRRYVKLLDILLITLFIFTRNNTLTNCLSNSVALCRNAVSIWGELGWVVIWSEDKIVLGRPGVPDIQQDLCLCHHWFYRSVLHHGCPSLVGKPSHHRRNRFEERNADAGFRFGSQRRRVSEI